MRNKNWPIPGLFTTLLALILFGNATGLQAQQTAGGLIFPDETPEVVRQAAEAVYVYYPELAGNTISIEFNDRFKSAFMQAQPRVVSLLTQPGQHKYRIVVTRHLQLRHQSLAIEDIDREVLEGWFAHELAHLVDYHQRSSLEMVFFGARYYLFDKFKRKAEHRADQIAIAHGLAAHILATKRFLMAQRGLPPAYRQNLERLYLTPEQVMLLEEEEKEAKIQ